MKKYNIVVAGIGGVGGYFGGKLANYYKDYAGIDVSFLARGNHLEAIRSGGLHIDEPDGSFTAFPTRASDDPNDLPAADLLVIAVKGYDLEEAARSLAPVVTPSTIILPLLNGIDITERLKVIFPSSLVLHGYAYIVSRIAEPGRITIKGSTHHIVFGTNDKTGRDLKEVASLFINAGIAARLSSDAIKKAWQKFTFISPIATMTCRYNKPLGFFLNTDLYRELLFGLVTEVIKVANAYGVALDESTLQENIERMRSLPYDTTSSMQADQSLGKQTEIDSLIVSVIRMAGDKNVTVPLYEKLYRQLSR